MLASGAASVVLLRLGGSFGIPYAREKAIFASATTNGLTAMIRKMLVRSWKLLAVASAILSVPAFAQTADGPATVVSQVGHAEPIAAVAFSPVGTLAATASHDQTVKLWHAGTGLLIRTFRGHSGAVISVAFSPDGNLLISGAENGTMRLWNARTGQPIRNFLSSGGKVTSLAFSPDGQRVASCNDDERVRLWSTARGRLIRSFDAHAYWASAVAFSPTGQLLSGGQDNLMKLWDANTGALIRTFAGHGSAVSSVVFSPDGKRIASGSKDTTVKVWDAGTGNLVLNLKGHFALISSVAFSPDGTRVLAGSNDNAVRLWDVATAAPLHTLNEPITNTLSSYDTPVAFSPDGSTVLSGGHDKTPRVWDSRAGKLIHTLGPEISAVTSVAFSHDGSTLLSGTTRQDRDASAVSLWDTASRQRIRTFSAPTRWPIFVASSSDGSKALWITESPDEFKLWDVVTGRIRDLVSKGEHEAKTAAFSPDGMRIVSGGYDKTLMLWDASTGEEIRTFPAHKEHIRSVVFSPDGRHIVSSDGQTLRLWDATTGSLQRDFGNYSGGSSLAFSPDGRRIAVGDSLGVRFAEIATGHLTPFPPTGTRFWVTSVAYSPDGKYVLSGSKDAMVRLSDAASGKLTRAFEGHSGAINSVAISPDGRMIASGADDGTTRIWTTTGELLATLVGGRGEQWLSLAGPGFFAAAGRGRHSVSVARGFNVIGIDQVHQSLFNPDLVRETLAGDPTGEVAAATRFMNLDKVLDSGPPPSVAVETPTAGTAVTSDLARFSARIVDRGKGVGRIEWRINGITEPWRQHHRGGRL